MRTCRYKRARWSSDKLQLFPLSLECNPKHLDRSIGKPLIALHIYVPVALSIVHYASSQTPKDF